MVDNAALRAVRAMSVMGASFLSSCDGKISESSVCKYHSSSLDHEGVDHTQMYAGNVLRNKMSAVKNWL